MCPLELDREAQLLRETYDKPEKHFTYPKAAMLRLMQYQRLRQIKHKKTLVAQLDRNGQGDALGFEEKTPDRRTIGHFYNHRLREPRLRAYRESLLDRLQATLAEDDITLGRRIAVDSTTLETLQTDDIGSINKQYFQKHGSREMVKIHIATCVNTGVPLAYRVTGGTAYDGHHLMTLVWKVEMLCVDGEEVYADSQYGSLKNWARVSIGYGAELYADLTKDAVERDDGTEGAIRDNYRDLWNDDDELKHPHWVSVREMCRVLMQHSMVETVGAYFRNQWWQVREYDEQEYDRIYHRQNTSGAFMVS